MSIKLRSSIYLFFTFLITTASFAGTNPFLASADNTVVCVNDGSTLPQFYLCDAGDTRSVQVNDPAVQSVMWQLLDSNSCAAAGDDCPNLNITCAWNTISTANAFTLDNAGDYRVVLSYASAPNEIFYAKSFQSTYSDIVMVTKEVSVFGGNDGEITISANGSNAPFVHQLSSDGGLSYGPVQNSPVFTNLSAGGYQIKTRDSSGACEYISTQVFLTEPEILTAQLLQTKAVSCAEGGEITAIASGGVPPYQYALNGGPFGTINIFQGLAPGIYTVEVRDVNNATVTTVITIQENLPITANYTSHDVSCSGMQDGRITVEPSGGTGSYQYQLIANGMDYPYQNSNIFENLAPNIYEIRVMDSGGCVSNSVSIIINEPAPLVVELTSTDPSEANASDGTISINTASGAGGYQYAISPNLNEFYTSNVFTGLSAGTYTILVQDQNGCVNFSDIVLIGPDLLEITATQTSEVTCNGANDAELFVDATGGRPPYEYSINDSEYRDSRIFSDIGAGTYTLKVRDGNSSIAATTLVIDDAEPLNITATVSDVDCHTPNDGRIQVDATGGNGNYTYDLQDSNGIIIISQQTSPVFDNLPSGDYLINVTDANGCLSAQLVSFYENELLVLEYIATNPSDDNTADGAITIFASGGFGPYEFSIDGGATFSSFNIFENLAVGAYEVLVRDSNGCALISTVQLGSSALTLSATVQNQITCNSNASVLLTPSGGVPPYEYSSNGSSYRTTNPFITGTAGNTTFTVRDATGATAVSNEVMITATPESISVNVGTGYDCNGVNLPRVDFQLTRGSGNMQYSIYEGIWQSSTTFFDVPDGAYLAKAKNDDCQVEIPITVANVVPVDVRILEQDGGWIRFQILGGTGPFNYRMNSYSAPRIDIGNETIFEIDGLSPGPHWLVVDAANCSDHVTFDIEGFIPELQIVTDVTNSTCFGSSDASINVTGVGGLEEYSYGLVDGDNNIIYPVRPEISNFEGLAPGTYQALLRDTRQGLLVRSDLITITEPEGLFVALQSAVGSHADSNTGVANLAVEGGTAPYEYSLDAGTTYTTLVEAKISELAGGDYAASIRDANGCQVDINFTIETLPIPLLGVEVEYVGCEENIVTMTVSGGSGDYLFAVDSTDLSEAQSAYIFTDITAGIHYATVFDANGYVGTIDFVIEDTVPLDFSADVSYNEDRTNASVSLEVHGGSAPYMFSDDGTSYGTASTFNDLEEGDHTFYVKDSLGCISEVSATITLNDVADSNNEVDTIIFQNRGTTEVITIVWNSEDEMPTSINVYNNKGNLVLSITPGPESSEAQIDVVNLSRGLYFIHIQRIDREEIKKVLVL